MDTACAPDFNEVANVWSQAKKLNRGYERFLAALSDFVDAAEECVRSSADADDVVDDVRCLVDALNYPAFRPGGASSLLVLKAFKIVSRKQCNRATIGQAAIQAVVRHLAPDLPAASAAEAASVLLNLCYEARSVQLLLQTPGPRLLVQLLQHEDVGVQANSAGAIQSISYQESGRRRVREEGAVPALVSLLASPDARVQNRAVGALHNLSSEPKAIRGIRRRGGIPHLVALLRSPTLHAAGSAAGTLQNIAREVASRLAIRELDAVPPLALLLSSEEVDIQVCAAGALLNILGPELDSKGWPDGSGAQRRGLGRILSLILSTSAVFEGVFGSRPRMDDDL